ncbi:hypothetical protein [Nostoc sp.]|uniref:hypothetical protein n=1 Tax=Nostoc sp. TaxID=1180 RepID=UPI002FFBBC38
MPLEAPNLDDRRFKDLFEELRSLIPRYAPEWTDHNLSDPGITMMQLFSYLGEIILFRLNRVPDRNYIKFLQLIGVEQKAAAPPRAEVTFTLVSPAPPTVYIPQGTQIGAQVEPPPQSAIATPMLPPEPEEPVIFETDEPLIAIGAELTAILVFDGKTFTAAFRAAEEDSPIHIKHLILSTKREYQKLGKICEKTEFEPYYELVR